MTDEVRFSPDKGRALLALLSDEIPECDECRRPLTWVFYKTPIMLKELDTGKLKPRHAQADCICGCSWMMLVVDDDRCAIWCVRWEATVH
jgi:hypothetical protein